MENIFLLIVILLYLQAKMNLKQLLKHWIKYCFSPFLYRNKVLLSRRNEIERWVAECQKNSHAKLSATTFNIFTYHGEDGIILYLIKQLKDIPPTFVDIGAGDCIKGNCANLAVHYRWQGLFIDQDNKMLRIGKRFYESLGLTQRQNLNFISATIGPENVNKIIEDAGSYGKIGLLSIDIDGNDYWIWEAIAVIEPVILVIEAKVEFGLRSLVVPYSSFNHRDVDIMYNGASVESLKRLGNKKGYQLVGANKQGYNLFFVREDRLTKNIPIAKTDDLLDCPDIMNSFYGDNFFDNKEFIKVE